MSVHQVFEPLIRDLTEQKDVKEGVRALVRGIKDRLHEAMAAKPAKDKNGKDQAHSDAMSELSAALDGKEDALVEAVMQNTNAVADAPTEHADPADNGKGVKRNKTKPVNLP